MSNSPVIETPDESRNLYNNLNNNLSLQNNNQTGERNSYTSVIEN